MCNLRKGLLYRVSYPVAICAPFENKVWTFENMSNVSFGCAKPFEVFISKLIEPFPLNLKSY